jgi:hypothetical protein
VRNYYQSYRSNSKKRESGNFINNKATIKPKKISYLRDDSMESDNVDRDEEAYPLSVPSTLSND